MPYTFKKIKNSPLSLRIILHLFLLSSLVILISASTQVYLEYHNERKQTNEVLQSIEKVHVPSITFNVYNVDDKSTKIQLKSLVDLKAIVYAEAIESEGLSEFRLAAGDSSIPGDIQKSYPLIYQSNTGEKYNVGTLVIVASHESLNSIIKSKINEILLENLLRTAIIAFFMFFLIRFLITQHLSIISNFADRLNLNNLNDNLFLNRKEGKLFRPDELDQITAAFNDLRLRLLDDVQRIEKAEKNLINSKEEYRELFEYAPIGLYKADSSGLLLDANILMIKMLKYENKKEILKLNINELFIHRNHKEEKNDKEIKLQQTTKSESRMICRDQSEIWVSETFQYISNDDGEIILKGSLEDITNQKRIESTINRSQKMEALGQLTGGIAHDFNNILGIIIGNIEILTMTIDKKDESYKFIDSIGKSADRAADLTKKLLRFSRKNPVKTTIVDINQKISEMESLIVLVPGIYLHKNLAQNLWKAEIDEGDFGDAILNLTINARDAMPNGGHITIETNNVILDETYCTQNPSATPGEYVKISISDNGMGMSSEQQELMFNPFYTTKAKGTGLGLTMAFGFVKRSKGHVVVYSEEGIGTTFQIYLPHAEKEHSSKPKSTQGDIILLQGTESILIVDDERELLKLAEHTLKNLGYRTFTAESGDIALNFLQTTNEHIDLVFSDVVMPKSINGYQLAKKAVSLQPNLKILLTSGFTEKAISKTEECDFYANLLTKPYTHFDLAQKLRAALDK